MSKALKNTLILIFSALLLFSCAIMLLNSAPAIAYADEETNDTIIKEDNNFVVDKATLDLNAFATGRNKLTYGVTLKNTDYTNLSNRLARTDTTAWGRLVDVYSEVKFSFILYRDTEDGNSKTALVEYIIWFKGYGGRDGNKQFGKVVAKKELSYYPEKITFGNHLNPIDEYLRKGAIAGTKNDAVINTLQKGNYEILSYGTTTEGFPVSDKSQTIPFVVETNGIISNYHVEFYYQEWDSYNPVQNAFSYDLNMEERRFPGYNAVLENEQQCVQSVLREMYDADVEGFNETFGFYGSAVLKRATDIVENNETITVKLRYLEEVEGTPFAQAKYKTVTVAVPNGKVEEEDMRSAVNLDSFNCLKAYGNKIKKLEEGLWEVEYYTNAYLRAKASNGKYLDYFFDINKSYHEYFNQFVEEGHLSRGCFEYVLNEIGNAYPQLAKGEQQLLFDNGNDLYGLWGYVQIPEGVNFDEAFKDIFNVKTTVGVQNVGFSYKSYLNAENYKALVNSQEFSKFEKWWSSLVADVAGGYEATTYIMVMEPGVNWIDHAGEIEDEDQAEDPNQGGVGGNGISKIGEGLGNAWNSLLGIFNGLTGTPGALAGTLVVVGAGVVLFILIKNGVFSSSGKTKQSRPKNTKRSKKK